MKRVTGIGGVFFNASDPDALQAWYKQHLGIDVQEWGGTVFTWTDAAGNPTNGTTVWSIGAADGEHFAPSKSTFMVCGGRGYLSTVHESGNRCLPIPTWLHTRRIEGC